MRMGNIKKAMAIISREQRRRESLSIPKKKYTAEMEFLRKYLRAMAKKIITLKKEMGHELDDDEKEILRKMQKGRKPYKKKVPKGSFEHYLDNRKTKSD